MNPFRTRPTAAALDELNRALLIAGAAAMLLKMFFSQGTWPRLLLTAVSAAALLFALIRMLSKNPARTNMQNLKYLSAATGIRDFFRATFTKRGRAEKKQGGAKQRKRPTFQELRQYKYFMCPQCAQRLRVPRGKGRLRVTCTRCGNRFEVRS